jgi:ABC-type Fe3+ transport system substrate-binding protein
MKFMLTTIAGLAFVLSYFFPALGAFAASAGMTRDQILAAAKNEGKLRVLSSLNPNTFNALRKAFLKQYSFIREMQVQEIKGTDGPQKFLLELKSGRGGNWDVFDVAPEFYDEFQPLVKKIDLLAMGRDGVVNIPAPIIDPTFKNIVAIASSLHCVGFNLKLLPSSKTPNSWEDFVKPEFKGRKFMVDIRPQGFAALAAGMGEEWVVNYARAIKEQDPVWVRGQSRALTAMATGEQSMLHLAYYHSCARAKEKDVTKSVECKVIEPAPARIQEMTAINGNSQNSNAALLWVEFQVSPPGQRIIDEEEPLKSSIYVPGSELAKAIQGKNLSVNNWKTFHKTDDWEKKVIAMFGFPQAQIK